MSALLPYNMQKSIIASLLMLVGATSMAKADAIDGNWCGPKGKSLRIDGPAIVTPGGAKIAGTYDRHNFTYVAPKGEDHSGNTLSMSQLSEERMNMTLPNGKVEQWSRCEVVS